MGGEPRGVSVSSHTGERSVPLVPQSQSVNPYMGGGPVPPPANWDPTLMELWVKFPGHPGPVFGWFREARWFANGYVFR